jgi:ketosteroid isomerase-like protein
MRTIYFFFMALLLLTACQSDRRPAQSSVESITNQIEKLMKEQEGSWNQGDLDGFMKHYWQSDSLKFVGKRGLTFGWEQTLKNYKMSYPDDVARGSLKFNNLSVDVLSDSAVFVIGKWTLFRSSDTLSGHYSLLWKKLQNNWVIVTDHSS